MRLNFFIYNYTLINLLYHMYNRYVLSVCCYLLLFYVRSYYYFVFTCDIDMNHVIKELEHGRTDLSRITTKPEVNLKQ